MIRSWFRRWYYVPLLFLISALAYLPHIHGFGYFRDDWYLMYSANAFGGGAFQDIYAIDRPARAGLMSLAYSLFGLDPLYYNLSAYFFRVLGALAFLWTLHMLWPRQRAAALVASILFLIYPGFLSSPNAIDYQAQQFGLFLAHLSIALSIWAVLYARPVVRVVIWLSSALMTWAYLGLVEYFLGLEVLRLAAMVLLAGRRHERAFRPWVRDSIYGWLPFSIGPLGFFVWRFFVFESVRKATDLGAQLRLFFESPILVGVGWGATLLKDVYEVLVLSWGIPLANLWNTSLRLREMLTASLLVAVSVLAVMLMLKFERRERRSDADEIPWGAEAFWFGLVCVVAGFIPVILSNRDADFYGRSRYMLASSPGAVIVLVAFVSQLRSLKLRDFMICLLVGVSVLTHHLNGIQWMRASEAMKGFWWQVYWRVPQIEKGTTLLVNYSRISLEEDYFVWGPANFIYYPQSTDGRAISPALSALVLNRDGVFSIQTRAEPFAVNRRSILTRVDYGNILILTQPSSASCVQVIDGRHPVTSEVEQYDIRLVADASNMERVLLDEHAPHPPEVVFGLEPQHGWCFYYQKASLAYQEGDWETVLDLGRKARRLDLSPGDAVEWMPFLQAAALLGDRDEITSLAPRIKKSTFLAAQACKTLEELPGLDAETKSFALRTFCESGG